MLLEGKRVFVVEDDPVNMAIMVLTLKSAGALVVQDNWNVDTINRLKDVLPIDVILLDLMLRYGTSGYDIFDQIKAHPVLQKIPVVVVSASDPSMEMNKAREMGFAGYIPKPIRKDSFIDGIAAVLGGQSAWARDAA